MWQVRSYDSDGVEFILTDAPTEAEAIQAGQECGGDYRILKPVEPAWRALYPAWVGDVPSRIGGYLKVHGTFSEDELRALLIVAFPKA